MFADKQIICLKLARHVHLEASLQKEPTSFVPIERTISLIYNEKLHRFFLVAYLSTSNMMNVCNMFFQSSIYVKITILTQMNVCNMFLLPSSYDQSQRGDF